MSDASVWILGATGRTGRAIAASLIERGVPVVLVGRNADRLRAIAPDSRALALPSIAAMAAAIEREEPSVVVNTVGPFLETADRIARACVVGHASYVDLANDIASVLTILGLHDAAVAAGSTLVTGAGFGVTGTESVVVRLCENRPAASDVRTDMMPSLALEAGLFGDALAASIVEGIPGVPGGRRFSGRRYMNGRLSSMRLVSAPKHVALPDGTSLVTVGVPFGELVAAQRASGAPNVIAASSEVPTGPVLRALLPLLVGLLAIAPLRRFARRRLGAVRFEARPRPRPHSWAHARVSWSDGATRDGFLRLDDAGDFTAAVCAEVATRLHAGGVEPGASTPAAAFGAALVEACGATFLGDAAR